jgi:hypothetical protein
MAKLIKITTIGLTEEHIEYTAYINPDKIVDVQQWGLGLGWIIDLGGEGHLYTISSDEWTRIESLLVDQPVASSPKSFRVAGKRIHEMNPADLAPTQRPRDEVLDIRVPPVTLPKSVIDACREWQKATSYTGVSQEKIDHLASQVLSAVVLSMPELNA